MANEPINPEVDPMANAKQEFLQFLKIKDADSLTEDDKAKVLSCIGGITTIEQLEEIIQFPAIKELMVQEYADYCESNYKRNPIWHMSELDSLLDDCISKIQFLQNEDIGKIAYEVNDAVEIYLVNAYCCLGQTKRGSFEKAVQLGTILRELNFSDLADNMWIRVVLPIAIKEITQSMSIISFRQIVTSILGKNDSETSEDSNVSEG